MPAKPVHNNGYDNKNHDLILAIDDEEFMDGMRAIAVPVNDNNGRFVAALAFHGPSQRLSIEYLVEHREVLFNGSQTLKQGLLS